MEAKNEIRNLLVGIVNALVIFSIIVFRVFRKKMFEQILKCKNAEQDDGLPSFLRQMRQITRQVYSENHNSIFLVWLQSSSVSTSVSTGRLANEKLFFVRSLIVSLNTLSVLHCLFSKMGSINFFIPNK